METAGRSWWGALWALPWLFFQLFPIADLVTEPRPAGTVALAVAGLVVFTGTYLYCVTAVPGAGGARWDLAVLAVLGVSLAVSFGSAWAGLMIYVSAAAAMTLPPRCTWPVSGGAAVVCAAVLAVNDDYSLAVLPALCLLTAFAMRGMRYLITVNRELQEAREELARGAVAEERLRFARDLHDLLGHSLSLIALKSELARRLAERDPARAAAEMGDVEEAARRALAEVREAVSGYRQVTAGQALAEARAALSGAGIAVRLPERVPVLPGTVDAALGWVVREAATNVLRHSGARRVGITLTEDGVTAALQFEDDGDGAGERVRVVGASAGSGLAGLRERVAALGGDLTAGPVDGGGWRLAARVPLRPAEVVAG
ncbi:sensor histidine kinase [Modestobacter roseus]|uniref:sensor histidine kinase n=1 Tax=Modestobacter roseus TaxID=1181884 RepID=UPI0012979B24|nr:sensor histidine kinase [Modestobacter roseus]MQA34138.1 sensor histidine kinase [Modestobacter roseus]